MTRNIIYLSVLLILCQILNKNGDMKKDDSYIRKVDLSQDYYLRSIMDDVLGEDALSGYEDDVFFDMYIMDHKAGTKISVNRLPKDFIYKSDNCIGFACYNGNFIMVNGDAELIRGIKPLNDSIKVKKCSSGPAPDGIKNWTYHIKDSICTRFFMGMGLMLLPEYQNQEESNKRIPIVTLPKRKTKNR